MTDAVALVGTSGAGKSTIGRLLADRLGVAFVDVDAEIERAAGRSIREIFAEHGEPHFRALERDHTVAALAAPGVVSLGGGAPMTPAVADALRRHPHVVWLQVDPAEAARRVGRDPGRPLLGQDDVAATLAAMLATRGPVYADVASLVVDTTGRPAAEVVAAIAEHVTTARAAGGGVR